MKTYKYIALAALALGFTACSQDDDFTPQQEDAVQIASANIATEVQTRVNTLDDGTEWSTNDQILLVNGSRDNKNSGTYTYDGTAWKLTEGMVLYHSSDKETNDFTTYYPASVDFTLPTDQSTEAGIMSADRMVATANGVAKNAAVALTFERQNAMVTITPSFNTEFGSDATISGLQIAGITSYHPASATDYKAIIAPCTGFEVTVNVKVGETEQTLTAASTTEIEAGNHYTFSLTVGKAGVKIGTVSVSPWIEKTIEGGVAEEVIPNTFDATEMTAEQLNAAVTKALAYGHTEISVTLAEDADATMFSAITAALAATVDQTLRPWEMDGIPGTIDLTISGAKKVFGSTFLMTEDYNEYWRACVVLKTLTLPDVTEIEDYGINYCPNLTSVSAPKCEVLGEGALAENSAMTSVYLPAAKIIGSSTDANYGPFCMCDNLTEISLPEATTLGNSAFAACSNLKTVYLPKVTEIIGYDAFKACDNLEEITLGALTTVNNDNAGTFNRTPTGNLALVLSADQKVMNYDSSTKIYTAGTEAFDFNTTSFIGYTFKSITAQQ